MGINFYLLAFATSFDVVSYKYVHSQPIERSLCKFHSIILSRMFCSWCVMAQMTYFLQECGFRRNVYAPLICQQFILNLPICYCHIEGDFVFLLFLYCLYYFLCSSCALFCVRRDVIKLRMGMRMSRVVYESLNRGRVCVRSRLRLMCLSVERCHGRC